MNGATADICHLRKSSGSHASTLPNQSIDLPQYISSGQFPQVSHGSATKLPQLGKFIIIQFKLHLVYQLSSQSSHSSHDSIIQFQHPVHTFLALQNAPSHIYLTVFGSITFFTFVHKKAFGHTATKYCPSSSGIFVKSTVHHSASHL